MPSVPKKARFIGIFLTRICSSLIKALPNKTSKNSRRLQFFLKLAILAIYAWSIGIRIIPTSIYRTEKQQNLLYQIGRTVDTHKPIVTTKDGYRKKSRHQKWEAGDLLILEFRVNKFISKWAPKDLYLPLCEFWERLGGTCGYRWTNPFDPYHFQL